ARPRRLAIPLRAAGLLRPCHRLLARRAAASGTRHSRMDRAHHDPRAGGKAWPRGRWRRHDYRSGGCHRNWRRPLIERAGAALAVSTVSMAADALHRRALVLLSHDHLWQPADFAAAVTGGVTAHVVMPFVDLDIWSGQAAFDATSRREDDHAKRALIA